MRTLSRSTARRRSRQVETDEMKEKKKKRGTPRDAHHAPATLPRPNDWLMR